MDFANRRKSIIKGSRKRWLTLVAGGAVSCAVFAAEGVYAQPTGLSAPQKQAVTFTFGLGSSELNEKYGQNVAAMEKFSRLIGQVAEMPEAKIDSIVIVANSSTAQQLGSVEVAERRVQTVRGFVEPIILASQLNQAVVVTGHVMANNNVFMPDQMFDRLKKVSVTVFLNGLPAAGKRAGMNPGPGSAAEEEQRYISPFGGGDIFGRNKNQKTKTTNITTTAIIAATQAQQPQQALVPQQPQQVQQPLVPQQPQRVTAGEKTTSQSQYVDDNTVNKELQQFIDSLTIREKAKEIEGYVPEQKQPTEADPCPADRNPEIDEMIRRLLAEQAASEQNKVETMLPMLPILPAEVAAPAQAVTPVAATATGSVSASKKTAIVEYEISGNPQLVKDVADAKKIKVKPIKPEKQAKPIKPGKQAKAEKMVKEAKVEKVEKVEPVAKVEKQKPVKAAKTPHEPITLVTPIVGVKTNLVYWAGAAANIEAEIYFARRWSAMVEGVYTTWEMNLYKKNYAVNEISPEVRYWVGKRTGQYRGFYVGVYGHLGQFDYMFKNQDTGNTGDYYGGGISVGAYLPITRHFGIELGLRGGVVHANYDRYYEKNQTFMYRESGTKNYLGLTGAKISLVYRFGMPGTGRK